MRNQTIHCLHCVDSGLLNFYFQEFTKYDISSYVLLCLKFVYNKKQLAITQNTQKSTPLFGS